MLNIARRAIVTGQQMRLAVRSLSVSVQGVVQRPDISVAHVKSLRTSLVQMNVDDVMKQFRIIEQCNDESCYESGPDLVLNPLVNIMDKIPSCIDNYSSILRSLSLLGFNWQNHRSLIIALVDKCEPQTFQDTLLILDCISDFADWEMLSEDDRTRVWQWVEKTMPEQVSIAEYVVFFKVMYGYSISWEAIPENIRTKFLDTLQGVYEADPNFIRSDEMQDLSIYLADMGYLPLNLIHAEPDPAIVEHLSAGGIDIEDEATFANAKRVVDRLKEKK